jgi:hypothetical protein
VPNGLILELEPFFELGTIENFYGGGRRKHNRYGISDGVILRQILNFFGDLAWRTGHAKGQLAITRRFLLARF